jgi:hypothetical protein
MSSFQCGGRRGLLVLICLLALSTSAGTAFARPRPPMVYPPEGCPVSHIITSVTYYCEAEFTLRGSNGYRITVSSDLDVEPEVELTAERRGSTAQYTAPAKMTGNTLRASFGRLGRIAVRFRPNGRERHVRVRKKCMKDRPPVVSSRLGSFEGTIRFRGERGYTEVSARHAPGGIGDPLANTRKKMTCEFRESEAERQRELESVSLDGSPPHGRVAFTAFRLFGNLLHRIWAGKPTSRKGDRYLFLVLTSERVGRISIFRYAASVGGSKDFLFDDALTTAEVTPPPPFAGRGSFHRNADGSTSWTGTLSVPLPGLGRVRLTGGSSELATVETDLKQFEEEPQSRGDR